MEGNEVVRTKKSRAKYEVVILLIVIVAALIAGFGIYKARSGVDKGKLLMTELEQIRSAITTYKTLNKVNPPTIEDLTKLTYSFSPNEKPRPYLSDIAVNREEKPVDPFGNPYKYDVSKGWVTSSTKGYAEW